MELGHKILVGAGIGVALFALSRRNANAATLPAAISTTPTTTTTTNATGYAIDTTSDPSRGNAVTMQYQQALASLGYDPGPIDGRIGPLTRNAIADFQRDANLPVTSQFDAVTRATIDNLTGSGGVQLLSATAVSGFEGFGGGSAWKRY